MLPPPGLRPLVLLVALVACRRSPAPAPTPAPAPAPAPAPPPAPAPAPAPLAEAPVVQLALGHARACALRNDGRVVCWGPALAPDPAHAPIEAVTAVADLDDAVEIAGDNAHWCARTRTGALRCWDDHTLRASAPLARDIAALSAQCVLHVGGTVSCWKSADPPRLEAVSPPAPVRALGDGPLACVIGTDGAARCLGEAIAQALPPGAAEGRWSLLRGLPPVDALSMGLSLTHCARVGTRAWCWGGEDARSYRPTPQRGLGPVRHVAVAEYHACALGTDGAVWCWGHNSSGQLGRPAESVEHDDTPRRVDAAPPAVTVVVGGGEPCGGCGSVCITDTRGAVWCWGQLNGRHTPTRVDLTPRPGAPDA